MMIRAAGEKGNQKQQQQQQQKAYCCCCLETVGLRVPNSNFRDFSLFNVDCKRRNFLSAGCASTAGTLINSMEV